MPKIELTSIGPVTLKPGGDSKPIAVKLKRNGFKGLIAISFSELPKTFAAATLVLDAGQEEGNLDVRALLDAVEGDITGQLVVKMDGYQTNGGVKLTVEKPLPPPTSLILTVPALVTVEAGGKKYIDFSVVRKNCTGPVSFQIMKGDFPELQIKSPTILSSTDSSIGTISLDSSLKSDLLVSVKIVAKLGDIEVEREMKVLCQAAKVIAKPTPQLAISFAFSELTLRTGETKEVEIKLDGKNISQNITIKLKDSKLYSASPVVVSTGQTSAKLILSVLADSRVVLTKNSGGDYPPKGSITNPGHPHYWKVKLPATIVAESEGQIITEKELPIDFVGKIHVEGTIKSVNPSGIVIKACYGDAFFSIKPTTKFLDPVGNPLSKQVINLMLLGAKNGVTTDILVWEEAGSSYAEEIRIDPNRGD